jgi:hypothetical protein
VKVVVKGGEEEEEEEEEACDAAAHDAHGGTCRRPPSHRVQPTECRAKEQDRKHDRHELSERGHKNGGDC